MDLFIYFVFVAHIQIMNTAERLWTDNTFYLSGSKHADTKKKKYMYIWQILSDVRTKNIKLYNDAHGQV